DFILDSHVVGVEKPRPEIFHMALKRAGIEAREAVFVGDSYATDIAGARAAGLRGVLFDDVGVYDHSGDQLDCPRITALPQLAGGSRRALAVRMTHGQHVISAQGLRVFCSDQNLNTERTEYLRDLSVEAWSHGGHGEYPM